MIKGDCAFEVVEPHEDLWTLMIPLKSNLGTTSVSVSLPLLFFFNLFFTLLVIVSCRALKVLTQITFSCGIHNLCAQVHM